MALCWHCFRETDAEGPCPHCGFDPKGQREKYPLALTPGSILNGRYTVGRVLGQGGFGITYIVQDYQSGQRAAVKEYLPTEFAGRDRNGVTVQVYSGERKENFNFGKEQCLHEAKTLAEFIGEEHIVQIRSYFEENNTAYYVMEYVDGPSLKEYTAQRGGRLSPQEAGSLLLPVMEFLARLHKRGIIHRDIAPDNIIIESGRSAKLIDFGAARYSTGEKSRSLDVVVKHGFAPYEQYMHRSRQGPWTDVYAMAATFYFALTGIVPPESVERREDDRLLSPSSRGVPISRDTEAVLRKAMAVQPMDRYPSMAEFYRDLQDALAGKPVHVPEPVSQPPATPEPKKKSRLPLILAAAAVVALAAGIGIFGLRGKSSPAAAPTVSASPETPAPAETAPPVEEAPAAAESPVRENPMAPVLAAYRETLSAASVGDTIRFGRYEQDGIESNGKEEIVWQVLAKEDGRLLVISQYALDCLQYNVSAEDNTWKRSSLRGWMNADFLQSAFRDEEQMLIPILTVSEGENTRAKERFGSSTNDQLFLLSLTEAESFFSSAEALRCTATDYAKARGCYINSEMGTCIWWLRAPGSYSNRAAYVDFTGSISYSGDDVTSAKYAVRPLLWLQYEERGADAFSPPDPGAVKPLRGAEPGDTVLFGACEQDNDFSNGREEIAWVVLAKRNDRILVCSRDALAALPFSQESGRESWGASTLRDWLNERFLQDAFSPEEQDMIPTVLVSAEKNPDYGTSPGGTTKERIFLLNIQEIGKYFPDGTDCRCRPTPYTAAMGGNADADGFGWWWLRSAGRSGAYAATVYRDGAVDSDGAAVQNSLGLVRPAMWINLPA